jgi:hypothetical protein
MESILGAGLAASVTTAPPAGWPRAAESAVVR